MSGGCDGSGAFRTVATLWGESDESQTAAIHLVIGVEVTA